jgi:hypothetical protein
VVYVFDIFIMQDQRFHPLFLLGMVVVAFAMVRYNRPTDLQQPERVLAVSLPTVVAQTGVGAPDGGDQAPLLDDLPDGGDQAALLDDLPDGGDQAPLQDPRPGPSVAAGNAV